MAPRIDAIKDLQKTLVNASKLCLVVKSPGVGTELVISLNAKEKVIQILNEYTEDLRLKSDPHVQLVAWFTFI